MARIEPLTAAVFHILLALADHERHGYGIMQEVEADSGGALKLGPGTTYGCLARMLEAGLVEMSDERLDPNLDDQRRRYYRISSLGTQAARDEAARLASAVAVARAKKLIGQRPKSLAVS